MRYLQTFYIGLPGLAVWMAMLIEAGPGPFPWMSLLLGVLAGSVLGAAGVRLLRRRLLRGIVHPFLRSVPGGMWFFVLGGLGVGVVGLVLWERHPSIVIEVGVGALALLLAAFVVIGVWVAHMERKHQRQIWMKHDGVEFDRPLDK